MRFKCIRVSEIGDKEVWQVEDTRHKEYRMPQYSSTINFCNILQAMKCCNAQNDAWEQFLSKPY